MIVFIHGLNLHKTPEIVQKAISSDEAFGPIPIVAVFDAAVEKQLGVVAYYSMKDVSGFKDVQMALADNRGEGSSASAPSKPLVQHLPETWKDKRGRALRASYVDSTDEQVTLRLKNGKMSTIEISTLSEGSRERVAELAQK